MSSTTTPARRAVALVATFVVAATLLVAGAAAPSGAAAPTSSPTITSANGTSHASNPVLQWQPLPDVVKYRLQVSASASFSSYLWNVEIYNVSATPPMDLPIGTVYWRVAGMDGSATGPFADASFTRTQAPGPDLLAPADNQVLEYPSEPVVLRWEPIPGVKSYRVEVDDATDFIGAQTITTDASNWALLNTQPIGQTFYWRVQGLGTTTGLNTQFSQTRRYELAWAADGSPSVPTLLQPADGANVTDVVFRWTPVLGAATYRIQVSPNGDWANNVTIDQTVKGTSFSPAVTLNNASYFWRVRAQSVRNPADAGSWSPDGRQFTRSWGDVPALRSPADGSVNAPDYLLQWDPVPFASAYELQVGTDQNFSPGTFQTCTTNHTDWAPYWRASGDPDLPPRPGTCPLADSVANRGTFLRQGVRYYWRVRGLDQSQPSTAPTVLGRFSDAWSFIYDASADGRPQVVSPGAGARVTVPTLTWTPVRGAESYQVIVYVDDEVELDSITWSTSFTPSLVFEDDVTSARVRWTVRALQSGGSGNSDAFAGPTVFAPEFTLELPEPGTASTPVLQSPAAAASTPTPSFDWAPVAGAYRYELRLFPAGSSIYSVVVDHNEGANSPRRHPFRSAFTPTLPMSPGSYEWQVVAFNEAGAQVGTASERRALTVAPLPVVTPTAPATCAQGSACTVERSTPLLRWNAVPGAGLYRVHIALDPEFTNVRHVYTTSQPALRPTEALPDNQAGQSYYWFVQPCRSTTVCGRFDSGVFGTARAFRKGSRPITLTSPAAGARVANLVTFAWQAPSAQWVGSDSNDDVEARHYRIQVSTRPDFATILDTAEVDQRTYTPFGKTYPEGPLYWRVQARDGSGNYLTLSESRVVFKSSPLPQVTSPTSGDEASGLPVIQWDADAFAAGYEVEYYRNGDTTWTSTNKVQTTRTQLTADTMVKALPVGTYAYRVRRVDVDGLFGPWSSDPPPPSTNPADGDRRTFVVVGDEPSPTAPANGTVFSRPRVRLEWEPVPAAVRYRLETSASAGLTSPIESQITVMSAWSLVKTYPNGTIYWRVQALDAQDNVIGTSAIRTFVHDLSRPTAAITKVSPGPGSARVEWSAAPATASGPITSFVVTTFIGNTAQTPTTTVGGAARSAVVPNLVNGTSYRFKVTPYDANGIGTQSSFSSTVKPQKVAPFTSVDRFIERQFLDLWGRRPTSAELSDWRTRLNGAVTPEQMINTLWVANPHASVMPQITRLYSAFYVRIPDHGGLVYWAGQRRQGVSLAAIANTFARTPEFRTLYGTVTNAEFVDLVYTNVLGRAASATDRAYWTTELNAGRRTRGTLMIGFSESPEYRNKTLHDINAAMVVIEMLQRTPSTVDRDLLAGAMRGGTSLMTIFGQVLASPEYAARAT